MKESNRQKKFGRLIQQELSAIFQRDFSVPGGVMLTVTVVRSTPDLAIARIYVSVFPEAKGGETVAHLNESMKEIRHLLGRRIRQNVRHIPELEFFLDDTLQEVERMDRLFDEIKQSDPDA